MTHDPERDAALYLSGGMRTRRERRFEEHLLECEDCWHEVSEARAGRALAEAARDVAPQHLRERIRATIAAGEPPRRRARPVGALVTATAAVTLVALGLTILTPPQQPAPIAAAVRDFREGRMVADALPRAAAPSMEGSPFRLASAGTGTLEGLTVEAFMYKDAAGHRLLVYRSDAAFPVAAGAALTEPGGPWRATVDGIAMLCTSDPHAMLALADDPRALDALAGALDIDA